ncbi:MAG TPA: hypothetical protein PLN33_08965 [Hyphomonadaceae bacterium]|nr:hypothetical protein [Hyphomonadaceae bacterium]
MTRLWTPYFVLPNVQLSDAIECDIAAIAPANDQRVAALKRQHPMFRRFLNRFADNFGEKFEPAALILDMNAARSFQTIDALAGFRDVVAISTVTQSRAQQIVQPRGLRVCFGEAFALYPWMLDRNYEDLIGNTPAILGTHEVASFRGQSSPALPRHSLRPSEIDGPLFEALVAGWKRQFSSAAPVWADTVLMRSLNMAYNATLLPAGTDTTLYDVGRIISLWVSAFEILVHPGGTGQANRDRVFDLIEKTPWVAKASAALSYDTGGKVKVKRTAASWLYQKLLDRRNDFLHGNPVDRASLILEIPKRSLFEFAAPLYRLALTSFLCLKLGTPAPDENDLEFASYIAGLTAFQGPQLRSEKAVLAALKPRVAS